MPSPDRRQEQSSPKPPDAAATRVLCVDDDPLVLSTMRSALMATYDVVTVRSGGDALAALQYSDPFGVIVTDFEMPGMDGVAFLTEARRIAPDAVRILVSGRVELDDVATAINEGRIFSFLRKPFSTPALRQAVERALEQYQLQVTEADLLQRTLNGAVRAMAGLLAATCPAAHGRALRLHRHAADLAAAINAPDRWATEIAALLAPLGYVTLPNALVQRVLTGQTLDRSEQAQVDRLDAVVDEMLKPIPRMEKVREILRFSGHRYDGVGAPEAARGAAIPLGARVLHIVETFDAHECRGRTAADALAAMRTDAGDCDPGLLTQFEQTLAYFGVGLEVIECRLCDVRAGMVFAEDVSTAQGLLLIARGQDVTPSLLARIHGPWESLARTHWVRMVQAGASAAT